MQFAKPPTSLSEQIDQLAARGMAFPDRAEAEHCLSHISYYRLAGYWRPYEADTEDHQFQTGTCFAHVLRSYTFDRELRLLLMDAIERLEISVRTQWMNVLVRAHGPHAHLDPDLFTSQSNKQGRIIWSHAEAIQRLKAEAAKSREPFIVHFRQKYREDLPPLWATCELMALGDVSRWFARTKSSALRNQVARAYQLDESILGSFLHHLAVVRNICAHHNRLWNREFVVSWKLPTKNPPWLVTHLAHSQSGKIYNTLVMIIFLMDVINPASSWRKRLADHIASASPDQQTAMGFPADWQARSLWQHEATP